VKTSPSSLPDTHRYIRESAVSSNVDVRQYDLGVYQIASEGAPSANTLLGQMWVDYDVCLYQPKIDDTPPQLITVIRKAQEPIASTVVPTNDVLSGLGMGALAASDMLDYNDFPNAVRNDWGLVWPSDTFTTYTFPDGTATVSGRLYFVNPEVAGNVFKGSIEVYGTGPAESAWQTGPFVFFNGVSDTISNPPPGVTYAGLVTQINDVTNSVVTTALCKFSQSAPLWCGQGLNGGGGTAPSPNGGTLGGVCIFSGLLPAIGTIVLTSDGEHIVSISDYINGKVYITLAPGGSLTLSSGGAPGKLYRNVTLVAEPF